MVPGGLHDVTTLDHLIAEATASGGSERANYQLFISGLCDVLGVSRPAMSQEANARNDYVFERSLDYRHPDGSTTKLYVDATSAAASCLKLSSPPAARLRTSARPACSAPKRTAASSATPKGVAAAGTG